jgi:general nucleoside transport system permease protein
MNIGLLITQVLRISVPYLFAASGGVVAERAGIISLTLEGFMLTGAFTATLGAYYTGNPWMGVLFGIAGGILMAIIHAVATIKYRADQVVVGIAINLLAIGATRFFLKLAFHSSSNSPRIPGLGGENSVTGLDNPLVWLGLLSVPFVWFLLYKTRFGLRVRAVGEHPEAAASLGIHVQRIQYVSVIISGILAGLGGTYLSISQHAFTDNLTAGRGFIAISAVIFGRWEPFKAALACLLFAAAETLQIQLQGSHLIAGQFVEMIPYALTIIALAGLVGRAVAPAALGKASQ